MNHVAAGHRKSFVLFAALACAVFTTALVLVHHHASLVKRDALAIGLSIDMAIVVPLAFYFIVVRRHQFPALSVVPVAVTCIFLASSILPDAHQGLLEILESMLIPAELLLLGWIAWRATRALRDARSSTMADPLDGFFQVAYGLCRSSRVAGVFASELGVFYYAFGSWGVRHQPAAGERWFSYHRRSGQAAMVGFFVFLMLAEGITVHLLLLRWSVLAAWILTILTIYAIFWLFAEWRASVLRPILVSEDLVVIRSGIRWSLRVPKSQISGFTATEPKLIPPALRLTFLGAATHWIVFSDPIEVRGPYGIRKSVRAVGIAPDDASALASALRANGG